MKEAIDEDKDDPQLLREQLHEQLRNYVSLFKLADEGKQALGQFFGLSGSYETPLTKEQWDETEAKVKADPVLNSLYLAQTMVVKANGG